MTVFLSPVGGADAQFLDNNGNPLAGGKLYTYAAGTTTPQATYTSVAGTTFHTNPIILDAAGRVPGSNEIWLADNQTYKFVLKDSNDVTLATWDQISGVNDVRAVNITYTPPLTGSVVATNVEAKLGQVISVRDFGAVGNPTAIANALAATSGPILLDNNLLGGVSYALDARSKKLRTIAGVIRQTAPDAGWEFLTPTGHDKLGFSGTVTVDGNGDLIIDFGFTASNVISLVVVPDEFYASQGLKIGSSVGLTSARLEAYGDMSAVITSSSVAFNGSLGLSDIVTTTVDATNGTITFTHPTVYSYGSSKASSVLLTGNDGTPGKSYGGGYFLDSVTDSSFVVQRFTPLAGVVTISASTPSVDTLCRGVTVAWDSVNTCFVITHPAVVSGDKHPVIGGMIRNPSTDTPYFYLAEFTTSTTETRIHVYDGITGAKITTPADNSMRFSFVRPDTYANRALSSSDGTQCQVFRQNIPLNFNKIFGSSGNIWLFGVLEVA